MSRALKALAFVGLWACTGCAASGVTIADEAVEPLADARAAAGFEIVLPERLSGEWVIEEVQRESGEAGEAEPGDAVVVLLTLRGPDGAAYMVWQSDRRTGGMAPLGPDANGVVIRGLGWNEQRVSDNGQVYFAVGRRFTSGVTVAVIGPARGRVHELAGSLAP